MANISWTSSSINSFFRTSLGNKSSVFDGFYSSLSDSALIKSGSYGKLMKSYYATLEEEKNSSTDKTTESNKTDNTTESSKTDKKKEPDVLDQLLSKDYQKVKITNTVLDDLLKKDSTYNSDGTKKVNTEAITVDTQI